MKRSATRGFELRRVRSALHSLYDREGGDVMCMSVTSGFLDECYVAASLLPASIGMMFDQSLDIGYF
jgi:hypothetical protein